MFWKKPKIICSTIISLNNNILVRNKSDMKTMFEIWKNDAKNVPLLWRNFFEANAKPPITPIPPKHVKYEVYLYTQMEVQRTISDYQNRGHLTASLDPLGERRMPFEGQFDRERESAKRFPLNKFKVITLPDNTFIGGRQEELTVRKLLTNLNESYCHDIGVEFMYNNSFDVCQWIRRKFENPEMSAFNISDESKRVILLRLMRAEIFDNFIAEKWPNEKIYSTLGCEMLIPAMQSLIDIAAAHGAYYFVLGMSTVRSRLNILANVFRKPLPQIFQRFSDTKTINRYTLGVNVRKVTTTDSFPTEFSIVPNPIKHLVAIDSLVAGRTKSEQLSRSSGSDQVWPIMIHEDEVMNSRGTVYEMLRLAEYPGYSTNGTIHIILTNQKNLPVEPTDEDSIRSIPSYYTDVAKTISAPVFHVNAHNPEAVTFCFAAAAEFRFKFNSDVFVDLVGYKRHYNGAPSVPLTTYNKILNLPTVMQQYSAKLIKENIVKRDEFDESAKSYRKLLEVSFAKAKNQEFKKREWIDSPWKRFFDRRLEYAIPDTSMKKKQFTKLLKILLDYKVQVKVHFNVAKAIEIMKSAAQQGRITWNMAEKLAIASMLLDNISVRLSGEDCEAGVYTSRHCVLYSVEDDSYEIPFQIHARQFKTQAEFTVNKSPQSVFAVLGFEYGYSQTSPKTVVIWEAAPNGKLGHAQYIIDNLISCGESKWNKQSGIVLLIPHGYDGLGPEQSSGRPERFLQMCEDDYLVDWKELGVCLRCTNWIVANVTTPSNYFHILRRQYKFNYRKPLVLFTPKILLAKQIMESHLTHFTDDSKFQPYIPDTLHDMEQFREKILLCCGQIYYSLLEARRAQSKDVKIALCRIEQLCPFPYQDVLDDIKKYSTDVPIYWVQEEPKNQGWWSYVRPRLLAALKGVRNEIYYIGKSPLSITDIDDLEKFENEKNYIVEKSMR